MLRYSLGNTIRTIATSHYVGCIALGNTIRTIATSHYVACIALDKTIRTIATSHYVACIALGNTIRTIATIHYVACIALKENSNEKERLQRDLLSTCFRSRCLAYKRCITYSCVT